MAQRSVQSPARALLHRLSAPPACLATQDIIGTTRVVEGERAPGWRGIATPFKILFGMGVSFCDADGCMYHMESRPVTPTPNSDRSLMKICCACFPTPSQTTHSSGDRCCLAPATGFSLFSCRRQTLRAAAPRSPAGHRPCPVSAPLTTRYHILCLIRSMVQSGVGSRGVESTICGPEMVSMFNVAGFNSAISMYSTLLSSTKSGFLVRPS